MDPEVHLPLISAEAEKRREEAVRMRRDFHRHAERGWLEFRTTAVLASRLKSLGYQVQIGPQVIDSRSRMGVPSEEEIDEAYHWALKQGAEQAWVSEMRGGFTGVVGVLEGEGDGPTVAMRFDIDANSGEEAQDEGHRPFRDEFSSINPGVMHNCGHDGHATMGITVASLLANNQSLWRGRLKIVFQPAEEGGRGALPMVEAGVVDDVDYFLALHVGVRANRTGKVVCGVRGFQATTKLDATFRGRSAHAGLEPEAGRNALTAAATALLQLQAIPRNSQGHTRINVGMMEGGSGRNIIPDRAVVKLETRGETEALDSYMQERAHEILEASARMHGVKVQIEKMGQTISGRSDPEMQNLISEVASSLPDFDEIVLEEEFGAGDDAAIMMDRVQRAGGKAAYLVLGTELPSGHHTPFFDFNEDVLVSGTKLFSAVVSRLTHGPGD